MTSHSKPANATTHGTLNDHNNLTPDKHIDLVQTHVTSADITHDKPSRDILTADNPPEKKQTNPVDDDDTDGSVFDKLRSRVVDFLARATDQATELIEENRDIPLSQESVNGLVERYVVKPVKYFDRLTTELTDHHFFLSGDMRVKGINMTVSGEFEVVTFEFNDSVQHMVFRQLGKTRIDKLEFDSFKTKLLTKFGLFYIQNILRRDPLAFALDYFKVATVKGSEYDFEIGRYFKPKAKKKRHTASDAQTQHAPPKESPIIKQLKRFQVKHAFIRDHKLYVTSGVKLSGFTEGLFDNKPIITDADMPEANSSIMVFDNELRVADANSDNIDTKTDNDTNTDSKRNS